MHKQIFYNIVKKIPYGRVATYGQVASHAGLPRHARHVGRALSALNEGANAEQIPWHRVVNAKGAISERGINGSEELQRLLLENEGVSFNAQGQVNLKTFQWQT